jgi:threonine aldolase
LAQQRRHANRAVALLADRIAPTPPVEILRAPQANSIFVHLPGHAIEPLQNWSFFWTWDASKNLVRWMTSFATTEADVARSPTASSTSPDPPAVAIRM